LQSALGDNCLNCILQIGVGKALNAAEQYYYAWGRDPSAPGCQGYSQHIPGATPFGTFDGQAHTYKVEKDPSYADFDFDIDGVLKFQLLPIMGLLGYPRRILVRGGS